RLMLASEPALSAVGPEAVQALADQLAAEAESGRFRAVLVEQITEFTGTEAEMAVDTLVKAAIRAELLVVGEAETSTWSSAWQLGQPFKSARRGLLLTPSEGDSDSMFGTPTGRIKRSDFPAGRGFLIDRGRARKVQVALADAPR
ncbi:MAG TPA: hypothetical protein VJR25_07610, partial [Microbacterium sp.]|uniref:hypothetical protein n=1 Tax=Microbacterium sp. TaxID=51671 RepID=UPI002B4A7666